MKTFSIRDSQFVRLSGRFDPKQEGFPMLWSASSAEMCAQASSLEVQIDCAYHSHKPYLSFEVDGLRAQTFAPLPGKRWYSVFLSMDPQKAHQVRVVKESQAFPNDPSAGAVLLKLRTDGKLLPLKPPARRIEFIGDSITTGEGGRGPQSFMEWVPMCFSASDNYTRLVADRLNAQYHVIAQSGWGLRCGWDNDPRSSLARVYDQVCGPQAEERRDNWGAALPYDHSAFHPDDVVVALGANDQNAVRSEPFTDPATGRSYRLTESDEDMELYEQDCLAFLRRLHRTHPAARILWVSFVTDGRIHEVVARAVEKAAAEGLPVRYDEPLRDVRQNSSYVGSREHPGLKAHRAIAKKLCALLRS